LRGTYQKLKSLWQRVNKIVISNEKTLLESISRVCKEYAVGKALKRANAYKSKGTPVLQIFTYLLQLVYTKKVCI